MKLTNEVNSSNFMKLSNGSAIKPKLVQQNLIVHKDTLTIGQQARNLFKGQQAKTSLIESLMKQRENIQKMKSDLSERTLESGGDLSAIKEQLKDFEKQLADIDAQIAEQQTEEQKKATNQNEQDLENEKPSNSMGSILEKSVSLEQMKTLESTRNSLGREHNLLTSELGMDAGRGIFIDSKYEKLSDVENRIQTVQEQVAEEIQNNDDKELNKDVSLAPISEKEVLNESKMDNQW